MKVLKEAKNPYIEFHKVRSFAIFALLIVGGVVLFTMGAYFVTPLLFVAWVPLAASAIFLRHYYTWEAGTWGERAVVRVLRELDDSYYLLSNVKLPRGRGDIDHILLSPDGVFVIETKNYSGRVMCDRDDWYRQPRKAREKTQVGSISEQARRNALDLRNFLWEKSRFRVHVSPICVFTNPSVELELKGPAVPVLRLKELTRFVQSARLSTALTEREIKDIGKSILANSSR
jgi:hypothetical protein